MKNYTLGALTAFSSMIGIFILAILHDSNIITLSPFVSMPLVLISLLVTIFGLSKMFAPGELNEQEVRNERKNGFCSSC